MTPPPWHVTHSACARYAHIHHWMAEDIPRATRELEPIMYASRYHARDRYGRELWRCGRPTRMRFLVDPRVQPGQLPELIWCGQGRPPTHLWSPT